ncbi:MAG TPA: 3-hydroxyacyl-ACP dehydratase FabZ [Xanthomonadaceae bacterium]|jgi:3-hydroxyacyl-[acyl-carrier-protein] dehydratase|nr:3-hydroxyacyl-ACP dehydratase FabZ [Xanthomonadaceae bacterium]
MNEASPPPTHDVEAIMAMLPHRYPFLMVDRVLGYEAGKSLRATKNVTVNEPFFQGHFPGHPVMPGVMIIEAMAQAAGLLVQISAPPRAEGEPQPIFYLVKVDKARFNRIVVPGDQLVFEVELLRTLRNMGLYACRALVDGTEVASAEMLCARKI